MSIYTVILRDVLFLLKKYLRNYIFKIFIFSNNKKTYTVINSRYHLESYLENIYILLKSFYVKILNNHLITILTIKLLEHKSVFLYELIVYIVIIVLFLSQCVYIRNKKHIFRFRKCFYFPQNYKL